MTRFTKLIAVILAAGLLFGMAGCDQTKDANAAIQAANTKAEEYAALDEQIATLMDEASAIELTPAGVKPGIAALDEVVSKYTERKAVIADIRTEFAKIADYDVSEEIKTYAAQQIEIADLLAQMDDLGIKLATDMKALYELIEAESTDSAKVETLSTSIEDISQQVIELDAQVAEKEAASDTYFNDQGLGK